jgi:uncharacterized protein YcfJ
MNKILAIATSALLLTSACVNAANSTTVQARVTSVNKLQSTVAESVPQQVCDSVRVPVYETRRSNTGGSTGDTVLGAVIGGAIGNQFGGGSGKDAMTVLGAIVGADAANRNNGRTYQVITGHTYETQCRTEYTTQFVNVNNGYKVTYEWNGLVGSVITNQMYSVNDSILVTVTMQ